MDTAKLEAFWNDTLARAKREPLNPQVEPVPVPGPYYTHRVSYQSWQGKTIRAYLGVPVLDRPSQRLPAIVTAPGYGGWEHGCTLSECQRGYLLLQVFPRDQGLSGGWAVGTYNPVGPRPLLQGIDRPEGYFYQGAYVDLIRGIDYLVSRPDVDPERIALIGTSQGGGIVLSVAGLEPRVKATVAHVPYFCDMRHNAAFAKSELAEPKHLDTFDFFDPVNLAPRSQAPTLLSSGGKDATCPAETIRAVFDRLPGIKALAHFPELIHTSSADFYQMSWDWMARYLGC